MFGTCGVKCALAQHRVEGTNSRTNARSLARNGRSHSKVTYAQRWEPDSVPSVIVLLLVKDR